MKENVPHAEAMKRSKHWYKLHCQFGGDSYETFCGLDTRQIHSVGVFRFWQQTETKVGRRICPVCKRHPDLHLRMLGDLP